MAEGSCEEECPGGWFQPWAVAVGVTGAGGQTVGVVTARGVAIVEEGKAVGVAVSLSGVLTYWLTGLSSGTAWQNSEWCPWSPKQVEL